MPRSQKSRLLIEINVEVALRSIFQFAASRGNAPRRPVEVPYGQAQLDNGTCDLSGDLAGVLGRN